MSKKKNLEIITKACRKANPKLAIEKGAIVGIRLDDKKNPMGTPEICRVYPEIKFTDIILALSKSKYRYFGGMLEDKYLFFGGSNLCWNLEESVENQSPDTLGFIAEMLQNY